MVRTSVPPPRPIVRKIERTAGQRTTLQDIDAEYDAKIAAARKRNPTSNKYTAKVSK